MADIFSIALLVMIGIGMLGLIPPNILFIICIGVISLMLIQESLK